MDVEIKPYVGCDKNNEPLLKGYIKVFAQSLGLSADTVKVTFSDEKPDPEDVGTITLRSDSVNGDKANKLSERLKRIPFDGKWRIFVSIED